MTRAEAHIVDDMDMFVRRGIGFVVVLDRDTPGARVVQWGPNDDGNVIYNDTRPLDEPGNEFGVRTRQERERDTLIMTEDAARAIYDALADRYGHAGEGGRALRRDYDAERARVDRLIGAVIGPQPLVRAPGAP